MAASIVPDAAKPDTKSLAALETLVDIFGTKGVLFGLAYVCSTKGEGLADREPILAAEWRQLADDLEAFASSRAGLR